MQAYCTSKHPVMQEYYRIEEKVEAGTATLLERVWYYDPDNDMRHSELMMSSAVPLVLSELVRCGFSPEALAEKSLDSLGYACRR